MGHGMLGWGMGGGMGLGLLSMLFFWGILIAAIVFGVKWLSNQGQANQKQPSDSAMEILEKRYANGEIDEKEFRKIKNNLKGGR